MVQARAFGIIFSDTNRATQEHTIRYKRITNTGTQKVDVASNWEELVQILEIDICLEDKKEIERQVNALYQAAKTQAQKQQLQRQLIDYLNQRRNEFEAGEDSPFYKRDNAIIDNLINKYKLSPISELDEDKPYRQTQTDISSSANGASTPEPEPTYAGVNDENGFNSDTRDRSSNAQQNTSNSKNVDRLKRLTEMYMDGLISREEFEDLKNKN